MARIPFLERFQSSSTNTDQADDDSEQLAPDDPDPKGEHRDGGFILGPFGSFGTSSRRSSTTSTSTVASEREGPPGYISQYWNDYYKEFPLTRAPLLQFSQKVIEPGWTVEAVDSNGETDDEMTEALTTWGENCAIYAGESGHDLSKILGDIPAQRRGRGTALMEKSGTMEDDDVLAALVLHDPSTFKFYKRANKNLLLQPDDDVELAADNHKPHTTDAGETACYVQYDDSLSAYSDNDEIPFSANDIVKFVWDPDVGEAWGTSIFVAIDDRIDALIEKLEDRDIAIHMAGHPHRIYSSENWSLQEAKEYAKAHDEGDVSSWDNPEDEKEGSMAGRVDFASDDIAIQVENGSVADIKDAVMDDIEQIFSLMPISKFNIAYSDQINQFVVEPQQEEDDRQVDSERKYLEEKFKPIFEEKADELADEEGYSGSVSFSIAPSEADNPLHRESFPAENLEAFASAWGEWKDKGVEMDIPAPLFADLMGFDLKTMLEKHNWSPEDLENLEVDEDDENVQEQMRAMANYSQGEGQQTAIGDGGSDVSDGTDVPDVSDDTDSTDDTE